MIDLSALDEPLRPPVVIVEHKGREAFLLLYIMPRPGYGWIRYKDSSGEIEVALSECQLKKLIDLVAVS
jgi:hypothetical protein